MRHSRRNVLAGLASLAIFVLMPSPLKAQLYGSIVGTVTDITGAVVPGAMVTITNMGTNEKHSVQTDASGNYRVVSLIPANYRLEAEMAGFKRMTREPITVQVEATVRVDAKLEVGAISETVEVSSQSPLLQTETSSLSQVVEGQQVQEMPLNGRNIMNLVSLSAGVVPQGSSEGSSTMNQGGSHTNNAGWGNFQIGGGIAGLSAWFIDGAPLNVLNGNTIGLVATQDAVQEFRVASNSVSPEFGRLGGGVVNMTSKSGTNAFHGSGYGYLRNKYLNANDFFSNAANKERSRWDQYQYGATLGGPLVKDKLFFFGSWEGFKSRLKITRTLFVPTLDQRSGIFNRKITDPTGRGCVTQTGTNEWRIAQSCFDPTTKIMMDFYYPPAPNASAASYNWFNQPQVGNDANQYTARIDYNLEKQRIFGRYTYWNAQDIPQNQMNKIPNAGSQNLSQQAVVGDTYTFSPTTLLDLRVSYLRQYYDDKQPTMGMDLSIFGPAWATLNKQVTWGAAPGLTMSGVTGISGQGGTLIVLRWFNIYDLAPSLTKIAGNHTLKLGGEYRLSDSNQTGTSQDHSGRFTYDATLTGDEWAAFLLGIPTTSSIGRVAPTSTFNWYRSLYVADTWQASKNLTLNLGVRWELPGTLAERKDRMTVILPNTVDPVTNVRGTLALVKSKLYPDRGSIRARYNLFAPRVGLAYRLDEKTVLRAGYGLNWLPPDLPQDGGGMAFVSVINMASKSYLNTKDSSTGLLRGPIRYTSNPFPEGPPDPSGRTNPNFMLNYLGQNLLGTIPDQPYPRLQQWNLSLGRQFAGDWMVEIAYAGTKGSNLPLAGGNQNTNYNFNQLEPKYYSLGSALLGASPGDAKVTLGQSLRPYPSFLNIDNRGAWLARTNYHSMQVKLEKRFRSGGVVMANYTRAKTLGNTDTFLQYLEGGGVGQTQNFYDLDGEYGLSAADTPHRVVVSYVIQMPFGKGKRLANWNGFAGALVSGWTINGIYQYRTGFPIPLGANNNNLTTYFGAGKIRPNIAAGCNADLGSDRKPERWFNTSCFTAPGAYAFGNAPRMYGGVRADGVNNVDFSIGKAFTVAERSKIDFRAEAFNLFNRTQFALPAVAVDGRNFGVVTAQRNQPRQIQLSLRLTF